MRIYELDANAANLNRKKCEYESAIFADGLRHLHVICGFALIIYSIIRSHKHTNHGTAAAFPDPT